MGSLSASVSQGSLVAAFFIENESKNLPRKSFFVFLAEKRCHWLSHLVGRTVGLRLGRANIVETNKTGPPSQTCLDASAAPSWIVRLWQSQQCKFGLRFAGLESIQSNSSEFGDVLAFTIVSHCLADIHCK